MRRVMSKEGEWCMGRHCFAFLFSLILLIATPIVFAHDGEWGTEDTPLDITGDMDIIGSVSDLDLLHNDADPWKGWATINVKNLTLKNSSPIAWGDFHLKIKDSWCSDVDFATYTAPQLWIKEGSIWTQVQYPDLTWVINNDADNATMDLFFYGDPIAYGQKAKIRVYTDNTSSHHSSFSILAHPTPVPEPTTIILLGLGAISVIRRRRF
jgi:hypothetical protein